MNYSRRDFLKVAAAGIPVAGASWFFSGVARAEPGTRGRYAQVRADRIHKRSTEEAIRQAGEDPEEVKARVNRRLHELRANSAT
jgi:anaerobic selenocysteine-containing dehydrogenase